MLARNIKVNFQVSIIIMELIDSDRFVKLPRYTFLGSKMNGININGSVLIYTGIVHGSNSALFNCYIIIAHVLHVYFYEVLCALGEKLSLYCTRSGSTLRTRLGWIARRSRSCIRSLS